MSSFPYVVIPAKAGIQNSEKKAIYYRIRQWTISAVVILIVFCMPAYGLHLEYKPGDSLLIIQSRCDSLSINPEDIYAIMPDTLCPPWLNSIQRQNCYQFKAIVYPLSVSDGRIDSLDCINPNYLMILFLGYENILVIDKITDNGLREIWRSGLIEGYGDFITAKFEELNQKPGLEISIFTAAGMKWKDSVFLLSFRSDSVIVLNPRGKVSGWSEFLGRVNITPTDSGTIIVSYPGIDGVGTRSDSRECRTYFLKKGTDEIILISEIKPDHD